MRANLAKVQISLAVAFWLTAAVGVARGSEFFAAFLYFFAWWPLLFFLDGLLLLLTSESRLWDRPRDFLHLAFTSVTVWLVFELFNFRLLNWRYVGLEPLLPVRWAGYALSFATVLPGILLTSQVLRALGAWRQVKGNPLSLGSWQPLFLILGAASLALPLATSQRTIPVKIVDENRTILNQRRTQIGKPKISFTHLIRRLDRPRVRKRRPAGGSKVS